MRSNGIVKMALPALLAVAASGLLYALVLQLWLDEGLALRGIWTWNSADSAIVKVRIQNGEFPQDQNGDHQFPPAYPGVANVRLLLKARAADGTTVQGGAVGQIPFGATREFTIVLPKPATQLQFLQVLRLPGSMPT